MFRYNEGGEVIEVIIRDSSGAKIENHKFQAMDKKRASHILKTIMKKYNLIDKSDKDIDWLNKGW